MRKMTLVTLVTLLAACGGTDPVDDSGTSDDTTLGSGAGAMGTDDSGSAGNNGATDANNGGPSTGNDDTPVAGNNDTPVTGNNDTPPDDTNNAPGTPDTWRALVGNGDITEDTSSFSIVTYDGSTVTSTVAESFGTGRLAVASSEGVGYVVDIKTGEMLVIATDGTTSTVDLGVSEVDSATASNGALMAASGDMTRIAQYSAAAGGVGGQIPIAALARSGDPLYVRNLAADGNLVAGVSVESSMFPNTPQVFVADASSQSMVQQVGVEGAMHLDSRGDGTFALATRFNGIQLFRQDGASWVAEDLVGKGAFNNAEVEGVVMADANLGIAQTFSFGDGFVPYLFDLTTGTSEPVDGFAVPTALVGGDASADGEVFFIGDYGIRNQADWGVGVVDRAGNLVGHVITDETLPPMSMAAMD